MELKFRNPDGESILENILGKYRTRQLILIATDIAFILLSFIISISIMHPEIEENINILTLASIYTLLNIVILYIFRCYQSLWRYAGEEELISILVACTITAIPASIIYATMGAKLSIVFYIMNLILTTSSTGGLRLIYRATRRISLRNKVKENTANVLVVGAGSAGNMVIKEMKNNPELGKKPIGLIDDDTNKIGRRIHNVPVLGTIKEINKIVKEKQIDEIIIAIANTEKSNKMEIVEACKSTKCKLKTIPGIYEILDGKVDIKKIRDVEIDDLLGREPIKTNLKEISGYIEEKVVLITGGGGSIGSELCRQIARFNPKQLIILDNYENNAYAIQQELIRKYGKKLNLETVIASIREEKRMDEIFEQYKPQVVFHAAAHKHVPLMEKSPGEAIKNNIFGTRNVALLADKHNVEKFVLISTDKAVNPTNIMGATKRAAEMVIQTIDKNSKTEYVAVRFGNVLGSNGSVIPLFKKQIKEGGPVTITHPDIIRYFMTIPEAVGLVIQAGSMAKGGEIFILDMGDPVKIVDLATNLIELSGFEPGVDIKIKFTGLRPGEKLYEELLMAEEGLTNTTHRKIFIGNPMDFNKEELAAKLAKLKNVVYREEIELIEEHMINLVPTFKRTEEQRKGGGLDEVAATI